MSIVTDIKNALYDTYKSEVHLHPMNTLDEGEFILTLASFEAEVDTPSSYTMDIELSLVFVSDGVDETIDKLLAYIPLIDNAVSRTLRYKVVTPDIMFDTGERYVIDLRLMYTEVIDV